MDKDRPIEEVCALLKSLLKDDANKIIFCTGRVEDYREKTIEQINKILKGSKNIDIDSCLYMRPKGDFRKDFIVKRDLYKKMIVDGKPFYMKGICYHPVKIGKAKRSFETLTEDLILIKEAGINTIRVYEPIDDIQVLDELHNAGIKVVISFGYNQKGRFDIITGTFINYIRKYKDHDAILMWELGNEYNYNPQWFGGDINNWYKSMEFVAQIIQLEDPSMGLLIE